MADGALAGGIPVAEGVLGAPSATGLSPSVLALFRELGDLKRIRSADNPGCISERLFVRAWAALLRGEALQQVMDRTVAAALAAIRLGDIDRLKLYELGLDSVQALDVLERAFDQVAGVLAPSLRLRLRDALASGAPEGGETRDFVTALARQPRAGVTCPGRPRLMLQPSESHAEHCLMVAIYGVLACGPLGADPAEVFLAGLAHHLHNASLPDSGFTGEALLGDHLDGVILRAREAALDQLPAKLASAVRTALHSIGGDANAEARAFHVADVLDRVLEIEQHLKIADVRMADVLGPYALVHDGPVKAFHDQILREAELLA